MSCREGEKGSISLTFYACLLRQLFWAKKLRSQNIKREKPCEAFLYEKFAHKMLVKLKEGKQRRRRTKQTFEQIFWHLTKTQSYNDINLLLYACKN